MRNVFIGMMAARCCADPMNRMPQRRLHDERLHERSDAEMPFCVIAGCDSDVVRRAHSVAR